MTPSYWKQTNTNPYTGLLLGVKRTRSDNDNAPDKLQGVEHEEDPWTLDAFLVLQMHIVHR